MKSPEQFLGMEMTWFTGVVEDVLDPEEMGRVRVRCFGYHTGDLGEIPTESLPWAQVMTPVTSASMSGIGRSATGILPGSWVVGFFRDGRSAQLPLVMGTIPSMTQKAPDPARGFRDPSGTYPTPDSLGKVDTPSQATKDFQKAGSFSRRVELRTQGVPSASGSSWSAPDPKKYVGTKYPDCSVTSTKSGHSVELDDTSGFSRILTQHRSGTFSEVIDSGDRVEVVTGDSFGTVSGSKFSIAKGDSFSRVNGNLDRSVQGSETFLTIGDSTRTIAGSSETSISKTQTVGVGGDRTVTVAGNISETCSSFSSVSRAGTVVDAGGGSLVLRNSSGTLRAALDQLALALLTWVDTHGDSPNPATKALLTQAKSMIDGILG